METKVKRSFLERLTGSTKIEADQFEEKRRVEPTSYFEEENETEMILNNRPEKEEKEERLPVSSDDSEGQLTLDVYQTENDIVVKSTIAGVKPEDLDVSINNDMVTIRGERKSEEEVADDNYYYQECYWGSFSRSVILPVDVVPEKSEASMKNGILTIRLPKAATNRSKKIQVRGF
jgi:HSP20 family protein